MSQIQEIGTRASSMKQILASLNTQTKNDVLNACANALEENIPVILAANQKDLQAAREKGMSAGLLDRLALSEKRIHSMANGLRKVASLPDPVGEVLSMKKRPNGLLIGQKRVPLGVVAVIYEARPNVTTDVFGLCFKSGNASILKGGKDAANSNIALCKVLKDALKEFDLEDAVQLVMDNSHEAALELMRLNDYVDVLIPRGGKGLIQSCVNNATVPVIETGTGNCHVYVDESADPKMAVDIILNGKTQRVGVCNAVESVLIQEKAIEKVLPELAKELAGHGVEMRVDDTLFALIPDAKKACEEDWGQEYLDLILSMKTVSSVEEAIAHINKYNTGHSESIITSDYFNAQKFLDEVDAAAVYVNASTRFTDGEEFGLGAEIGISTQKLHARGPMGLEALTSTKYIIYGNGQVRPD